MSFEALVRPHLASIHRWALMICGHSDDADDVVQEVLLRLHGHRHRFPTEKKRKAWLYRITRNASLDRIGRRRRESERKMRLEKERGPEAATGPAPDREVLRKESARIVRRFLDGLSNRQREILDLVDLQGWDPIEAARHLGLASSTARGHLLRARRNLRTWILEEYPEWSPGDGQKGSRT